MTHGEGSGAFPMNRVVIERGQHRQIVYYWFEQRGRRVANEWLAKWYLITDAITMNCTDAALVRLASAQFPGETESDVDRRRSRSSQPSRPRWRPIFHRGTRGLRSARRRVWAGSRPEKVARRGA